MEVVRGTAPEGEGPTMSTWNEITLRAEADYRREDVRRAWGHERSARPARRPEPARRSGRARPDLRLLARLGLLPRRRWALRGSEAWPVAR